ncbi:MAG: BamA/TamA family outer membrane protein [Flavobacteriales bacterium]|nr:BamA/TamA family outer membrane protein [Flavobacteriales bacterium]MCB9166001.1 BamA/TamA family outer membrane protein [Flavobacteriales bacterium]
MTRAISIILVLWAGLFGPVEAQRSWIRFRAEQELPHPFDRTHVLKEPLDVERWHRDLVSVMNGRGYLEASVDTCHVRNDTTYCQVHLGPRYAWADLDLSGVPYEIAQRTRLKERTFAGRPISPRQLVHALNELLEHCENNGHPFASVRLNDLRPSDDGLSASVVLDQGPLITIDSILVKGTAHIADRYLQQELGIRPGDLYDETKVARVTDRTKAIPFVVQSRKPYVLFAPDITKLFLFLDARKASSINGILGVLPDAGTGKVAFTGDVQLHLRNALRRGEAIDLNWRSLKDRTQDLKVGLAVPYVFNTPFGLDLGLQLFRRDTTFLEVTGRGGANYVLRHGDKLSVFVDSRSSRTLGRTTVTTPGLGNVRTLAYGLGMERDRLDYRPNPRRGYQLALEGSVGEKESSLPDSADATSTVTRRSVQYLVTGHAVLHLAIGRRGTIRIATNGGTMVNDVLYTNELFRIGGLKSLRGSDEASIYASSWLVATLEFRLLLEENSNVFAFVDQGWWEDRSRDPVLSDEPIGFGLGTSFETKAGIFSLTYALGSQFDQPISFRSGKVHFGFTSLF